MQQLIFSFLCERDCAQLARTCKGFYDEAMDVVWADVETLVPFVRCMPSEVLTETIRDGPDGLDITIVSLHFVTLKRFSLYIDSY